MPAALDFAAARDSHTVAPAGAGSTVDHLTQPLLLHHDHEGGQDARHLALRSRHARALDYMRRVWASASSAVTRTRIVEQSEHAYEVLTALRAHLNLAEIAGASRQ